MQAGVKGPPMYNNMPAGFPMPNVMNRGMGPSGFNLLGGFPT